MTSPRDGLEYNDDWRTHAAVKGFLSAEDCERVLSHRGEVSQGSIQKGAREDGYRDSDISWVRYGEDTAWLFRKIKPALQSANRKFFHFALTGYTEPLQFTEYAPGQHYDWHVDLGSGKLSIRKLSFVIQLSDPADYDGGSLQLAANRKPRDAVRDRGAIVIFPSFVLHRVTPVKRGLRRTLVGWIGGPPFV